MTFAIPVWLLWALGIVGVLLVIAAVVWVYIMTQVAGFFAQVAGGVVVGMKGRL